MSIVNLLLIFVDISEIIRNLFSKPKCNVFLVLLGNIPNWTIKQITGLLGKYLVSSVMLIFLHLGLLSRNWEKFFNSHYSFIHIFGTDD